MPDIEKNHFEAPVKSNWNLKRCLELISFGFRSSDVLRSECRIACVAITAVSTDTRTPRPSMNAKPFTPAVARMNRMNATRNVTTFASAIAVRPLR